jgi:hypothetical protein
VETQDPVAAMLRSIESFDFEDSEDESDDM